MSESPQELAPRRSRMRMWTSVVVAAVVVVGRGVAAGLLITGSTRPGPDKVVRSYLTALAKGDAAAALRAGPQPKSTTFLTDDVLSQQQAMAKISDIETGPVDTRYDGVSVMASYRYGARPVRAEFQLRKVDGRWQLDSTTVELGVARITGATLFGKPLPAGPVYVFPGPLRIAAANPDLTLVDNAPDAFSPSPTYKGYAPVVPDLRVDVSQAGVKRAVAEVAAWLRRGASSSHDASPDLHPAPLAPSVDDEDGFVAGSASWRISSGLQSLQAIGGQGTLVVVHGDIRWAVTYHAKDSHGTVATRHETHEASPDAQVDMNGSPPTVKLV